MQTNADTMTITAPLTFDVDVATISTEYNNGASGAITATASGFGVTLGYAGSSSAATALSALAVPPV